MQETGKRVNESRLVLRFAGVSEERFARGVRIRVSERDTDGSDDRPARFEEYALLVRFENDPKRRDVVEVVEFFSDGDALRRYGTIERFQWFPAVKERDGSQEHKGDRHDGAVLDERVDDDGEKHSEK